MIDLTNTTHREIVISRLLNAPVSLVFRAWTEPEHLIQWWGPKGFTNTFFEIEVKEGGIWRFMMHSPDGVDYPNIIRYTQIVPNERIEYEHGSENTEDEDSFYSIITFESIGNQTLLTLKVVFRTEAQQEEQKKFGADAGGQSTFDCLEEHLLTM
jgi:uncharacterized protein YndB with AHSA1/START domain